jgi:hypothetical protein
MRETTMPGPKSDPDAAAKRPWEPPDLTVVEIDVLTARNPNPRDSPTAIGVPTFS